MGDSPVVLSHWSALEYWRHVAWGMTGVDAARTGVLVPATPTAESAVETDFGGYGLTGDAVELLVGDASRRRALDGFRCRLSGRVFTRESFVRISDRVCVVSPELLFLQMAGELDLAGTVLLGYEFCGSFIPSGRRDRRYADRLEPLTNVERLRSFLETMPKSIRGWSLAKRALACITDNAWSPMEPKVVALLVLPMCYGGYGFPLPQLNRGVRLSSRAGALIDKETVVPDIYWPSARFGLEYYGREYHSGYENQAADHSRQDSLLDMGIHMAVVTGGTLYSENKFDAIARMTAKQLGKRVQIRSRKYYPVRSALRRSVLGPDVMPPWYGREICTGV